MVCYGCCCELWFDCPNIHSITFFFFFAPEVICLWLPKFNQNLSDRAYWHLTFQPLSSPNYLISYTWNNQLWFNLLSLSVSPFTLPRGTFLAQLFLNATHQSYVSVSRFINTPSERMGSQLSLDYRRSSLFGWWGLDAVTVPPRGFNVSGLYLHLSTGNTFAN